MSTSFISTTLLPCGHGRYRPVFIDDTAIIRVCPQCANRYAIYISLADYATARTGDVCFKATVTYVGNRGRAETDQTPDPVSSPAARRRAPKPARRART